MKFRVDTIDLHKRYGWTTNDGQPIFVKVPVGVTEGFVRDMALLRGTYPDDYADEKLRGEAKDPGNRQANLQVLDLVVDWNFDDEAGKPIPLTNSIKPGTKANDEKRLVILSQLPIELPGYLAQITVSSKPMSEQAEGFSKTSSESS
ncbi:MAG: hypothetical protein ACOYB2_10605 [Limnohabitans sp.]